MHHPCRSQGSQQPRLAPRTRQSQHLACPATAGEFRALQAVAAEIRLAMNKAGSKAWTCGVTGFFLPCQREASAMQGGRDVCPPAGWTVAVEPLSCVASGSGLAASPHHSLGCPYPFAQISAQTPTWCVCWGGHRTAAVVAFTYRA